MPETSSLYPQPPQQNQQSNSLLNNPGQAIGLMQGIQNLQIQRAQAPALMATPQAGLDIQRQQLAQQQAEFDAQMRRNYSGGYGSWLTNLNHEPSDDEVRTHAANLAKSFGGARSDISDQIAKNILAQKNRKAYGNTLNAQGLTPGEFAQRVPAPYNPGTGATGMEPLGAATGRGGSFSQPGPDVEASTKLYYADAERAKDYQQQSQALKQIIPLLRQLGPAGTGVASGLKKQLAAVGTQLGVNPEDNENVIRDKLDKYFAMLGVGTPESARSDLGMHQRISANPNAQLSQGANVDLAVAGLAQKQLLQAQLLEASEGRTPTSAEPNPRRIGAAQYGDWAPGFNTRQDPRAYVMDSLDPKRRQEILDEVDKQRKSKDPGEKAKAQQFLDSYRVARSHSGLIDRSQFAGQ